MLWGPAQGHRAADHGLVSVAFAECAGDSWSRHCRETSGRDVVSHDQANRQADTRNRQVVVQERRRRTKQLSVDADFGWAEFVDSYGQDPLLLSMIRS
jgi:hypothetical protein